MHTRLRQHAGTPADKLLIFAKDKTSAEKWAIANEYNRHEVLYVTNYVQLRTMTTAAYPRVFLDGWKAHPQARSIAAELTARDKIKAGWRP
ncbi:hypothetical protein ACX80U_12190 [Arthrobacter sp. TmT3-37]